MFRRIEARGYRCLRSVEQSINPFEILNRLQRERQSSFLDVVAFLGSLVSAGLEAAVEERTTNFHDLVWGRDSDSLSWLSKPASLTTAALSQRFLRSDSLRRTPSGTRLACAWTR